jgi:hypothetical protein
MARKLQPSSFGCRDGDDEEGENLAVHVADVPAVESNQGQVYGV